MSLFGGAAIGRSLVHPIRRLGRNLPILSYFVSYRCLRRKNLPAAGDEMLFTHTCWNSPLPLRPRKVACSCTQRLETETSLQRGYHKPVDSALAVSLASVLGILEKMGERGAGESMSAAGGSGLSSAGKDVNVRAYTKKDGTQVQAYTRAAAGARGGGRGRQPQSCELSTLGESFPQHRDKSLPFSVGVTHTLCD